MQEKILNLFKVIGRANRLIDLHASSCATRQWHWAKCLLAPLKV